MINSQGNLNLNIFSNNHIRLGVLSKFILIITISLFLLSFLNKNFILIYSNIPFFIVYWGEIWRLLIGPFIPDNIFALILDIVTVLTIINYYENTKGSLKFTILFFSHLMLFQILAIILIYALSYIYSNIQIYLIKSLSPLGLSFVIQNIILSDFKHLNLIRNSDINNRFLFLLILISMIFINTHEFKFEIILSIIYGLFLCKNRDLFLFKDETLLFIEKHENFKILTNLDGNYFIFNFQVIFLLKTIYLRINIPLLKSMSPQEDRLIPRLKLIKLEKK